MLAFPIIDKEEVNRSISEFVKVSYGRHHTLDSTNLLSLGVRWVAALKHDFESALRAYLALLDRKVHAGAGFSEQMFMGLPNSTPYLPVKSRSKLLILTALYYICPWSTLANASPRPADEPADEIDGDSSPPLDPAEGRVNRMIVFEGDYSDLFAPSSEDPFIPITCRFTIREPSRESPRRSSR